MSYVKRVMEQQKMTCETKHKLYSNLCTHRVGLITSRRMIGKITNFYEITEKR